MRCCDFCGRFKPLTIDSRQTAHVICLGCVWACAHRLVEHVSACTELDRSALGDVMERSSSLAEDPFT